MCPGAGEINSLWDQRIIIHTRQREGRERNNRYAARRCEAIGAVGWDARAV